MAYKTGNPVGSTDPRDLFDNAGIVDQYVNGPNPFYPDRLGVQRLSFSGMRYNFDQSMNGWGDQFQQFLLNSGYEAPFAYGAGATLERATSTFVRDDILYRIKDPANLPYTLTGNWASEQGNFVAIGDGSLRQELGGGGGSSMIGFQLSGVASGIRTAQEKMSDVFSVKDFPPIDSSSQATTSAFQAAIDTAAALSPSATVYVPSGKFMLALAAGQRYALKIPSNLTLAGSGYGSFLELDPSTVPSSVVSSVIQLGDQSNGVSNVEIRGLRVKANQVAIGGALGSQTRYVQGIACRLDGSDGLLKFADNVRIFDNFIEDVNIGISCSKDTGIEHNSGARIQAQHRNWTVSRNVVRTSQNKAIELAECRSSLITNNQCLDVVDGPQVICASRDITIANNVVEFRATGINVTHNSRRIIVSGNECRAAAAGSMAAYILRSEPYADASAIVDVSLIGNTAVDDFSAGGGTSFALLTKAQNTSVQFLGVNLVGNTFTGTTRLYDIAGLQKGEARDWDVSANRFTQLASVSPATDNVTQISLSGNTVVLAYAHAADNWKFIGNTFKAAFSLGSTSSRTYHASNRAPSFSDSSASQNNRQGVNEYAGEVQRIESGIATSSGTNPFAVNFAKRFKSGTVPVITLTCVSATAGSEVNLAAAPTNTGFSVATFSGGSAAARAFHWTAVGVDG